MRVQSLTLRDVIHEVAEKNKQKKARQEDAEALCSFFQNYSWNLSDKIGLPKSIQHFIIKYEKSNTKNCVC